MEAELIRHLELLLAAYRDKVGHKESTVGKNCASDADFFERLRNGSAFTARKYDAVVAWFSASWPEGVEWPSEVARPEASSRPEENSEAAA